MTKIRKIIKINSGYTHYVDLNSDFFYYDEEKNLGRMERYEPIRAHRIAFEKIANSLNPKDRRFYFLSGSYGTGKSHLCLMLGNYLAKQSNSLEMETFFKNYEKAQKSVKLPAGKALDEKPASSLKAARKKGKYLVGICRYGLNLEFEGVVLRAIEEALEKSPDNLSLDTHYKEAIRKLKNWEKRKAEKPFFKAFEKELGNKYSGDWTLGKLRRELNKSNDKSFAVFKQIHKEVTDSDFTFSKDNLRDILVDLLTNEEFKKAYQGIAIIYDELGYALDDNLVNLKLFHEFAQFCANSGLQHLPVIFIGTGHKSFVKHGQVGEAVHYNTLKDRVNEISLQTDGMEDLIGAIVQQQKDNPIWGKEVTPHTDTFARFPVECKRLGIFNWLEAPKLKRSIIENIYPMHPLATYALLQMAQELGSDNRSVVKFFAPEFESGKEKWKNVQKYSYPWFIEHTDIIEDNKLKLYTADLLFDYFKNSIEKGETKRLPRIKASISNYEATLRSLIGYTKTESQTKLFTEIDPEMEQLLKSMLINEIISNEDIPIINTAENILFALNAVTEPDKKRLIARLEILCTIGVIFKNDNKIYEFRRSDVKDVRQMINQFRANPDNYPEKLLEKFLNFMPLKPDEMYIEAKDYNTTYNEDKRLQVIFVTPPELDSNYIVEGEKVSFFEKLELERVESGYGRTGYEGSAVFVFCDKEESIEQGKKSLRLNSQERVVVAVPKKHMEVLDDVLTLMAIQAIQASQEAETFGPHENAQLIEIKKTSQRQLEAVKNRYFDNKHMAWFSTKGETLSVKDTKKHDAANKVMSYIFDNKRNKISHMDFNKAHIKNDGVVRRILLEAGDLLLDLTENIAIDWTLPENRGGRKYLRRCFVDNQLLHHIHPDGDIRYFEVERDINKFKDSFSAYAHMIEEISELKGKGAILCKQFFHPYFEDYGQGEIAITLLLLLAHRFYGDSLRFKREKTALTDIHLDSTEKVIDLVTGNDPSAVLIFEEISEDEKDYFKLLCQIFKDDGIEAGKNYGINDAYAAITSWWNTLPIISKSDCFYPEAFQPVVETINTAETKDPYVFIKYDIPALFDISKDEKLTKDKLSKIKKQMGEFKDTASGILRNLEQILFQRVAKVFQAKGTLDIEIQDAIKEWFNDLDSQQKDQFASYHNNESKVLITRIVTLANIGELLFKTLPEAFGFGTVSDWNIDQTNTYITKIEEGKKWVEEHKSKVGEIKFKYENAADIDKDTVYYRGKLKITVTPENKSECIYLTEDGSEPSDKKSNRKKIEYGETLILDHGNKTLKFVACDKEGSYGAIRSVAYIDNTEKFLIQLPQKPLPGIDMKVTFIFPQDAASSKASIKSLFQELLGNKTISIKELEVNVKEILDKLKSAK